MPIPRLDGEVSLAGLVERVLLGDRDIGGMELLGKHPSSDRSLEPTAAPASCVLAMPARRVFVRR